MRAELTNEGQDELTNEGQDELTNEGQDKSTLSQTRVKMNRLHRILTLHGVSRSMFLHVRLCVLGEGRTKSEQPPNYPNRDLRTPNRDLRTPNRDLRTPSRDLGAFCNMIGGT